jgi:hypothetical protein
MRIIALAENAPVLLDSKSWIVVEVRSSELDFACQGDH